MSEEGEGSKSEGLKLGVRRYKELRNITTKYYIKRVYESEGVIVEVLEQYEHAYDLNDAKTIWQEVATYDSAGNLLSRTASIYTFKAPHWFEIPRTEHVTPRGDVIWLDNQEPKAVDDHVVKAIIDELEKVDFTPSSE